MCNHDWIECGEGEMLCLLCGQTVKADEPVPSVTETIFRQKNRPINQVLHGNSLEVLRTLENNSVDSIVTDPPYELEFMGKKWDSTGIAYNVDLWKECLRVLKPGGHMLVAGIGRTHHRVMVAIEDSGFEIRDCIYHLFGSGFPKSRNLKQDVERTWKCKLEKLNVSNVERCFYQSIGLNETDGQDIVVENVWELVKEGEKPESVSIVAKNSTFLQRELEEKIGENKALFVLWSVKRSGKSNLLASLILTGEAGSSSETTDMWLLTLTESIDLNTLSLLNKLSEGGLDQTRTSITLTELEQITGLKIWNSLLYQNILKNIETLSHTALKPAAEIWVLCRKPISEKTIAENVLKWGTGGLNIDGCRIELNGDYKCKANGRPSLTGLCDNYDPSKANQPDTQGRFPANVILDEEAAAMLDEQTGTLRSGFMKAGHPYGQGDGQNVYGKLTGKTKSDTHGDSGGASRFFYCAKASKKERGKGNNHPTVKPVKLMEYLITLVTPPNGIVLDPFFGSGTTGVAAVNLGFNYIGIELDEQYVEIARRRINAVGE
jgi:SAM-dependent methyltransferase